MPVGHIITAEFPTVQPTGAPGGDYQEIHSSPANFGGLTAEGEQKFGQGALQAAQNLTGLEGMISETAATNGETSYMGELGTLQGKLRSLRGMAAVNEGPAIIKQISALRQKYAVGMPNLYAQHAFNMLASRHEGYALEDANNYIASQIKQADMDSAHASVGAAIANAGSLDVAQSDERFNDSVAQIEFGARRLMQNQGWGDYMHEDPQTHALTFDTSLQGQQAKTVYQEYKNKALGDAYINRFQSLAQQNVVAAYNLYLKNRQEIPGNAQVKLDTFFTPKIRDAETRTTADTVIGKWDQQYNAGPTSNIADAIHMQESGGHANARTSVTGATGGWQLQPETFARFAKPGENINNPADNETVAKRYIAHLSQVAGGDPARIAVGYFSGEGNIAPPGSTMPWKENRADPTGKTVSSYVGDVMARLGKGGNVANAVGTTAQTVGNEAYKSKADYYRVNYNAIINQARQTALQQHPDDPHYADEVMARVEQRMNTEIKTQTLAYKADDDLVQRAFNGDLSNGVHPTTIQELTNISPQVKAAWERMQVNNPIAANLIQTHILTAASRLGGHDQRTYGTGFYDLFRRIHAPEGDPSRITDPTELYSHVGPNGDLTLSGLKELTSEIQGRNTPDGAAESTMKAQFLKNARAQITGTNEGLHIRDPKGDQLYLQFLAKTLPAYDKERKAGKSAAQLLDPESPDYIGKMIGQFKRPMSQWTADMLGAGATTQIDTSTPQALIAAVQSGKMPRAEGEKIALERGWIRSNPATEPTVPLSR